MLVTLPLRPVLLTSLGTTTTTATVDMLQLPSLTAALQLASRVLYQLTSVVDQCEHRDSVPALVSETDCS